MTNIELVEAELAAAKRKHPHFIDYFTSLEVADAEAFLYAMRQVLENRGNFHEVNFLNVLQCEMAEAIEARARGDLAHTRQELAQCAAVCIRGMEYIESELEKGGNNGH